MSWQLKIVVAAVMVAICLARILWLMPDPDARRRRWKRSEPDVESLRAQARLKFSRGGRIYQLQSEKVFEQKTGGREQNGTSATVAEVRPIVKIDPL